MIIGVDLRKGAGKIKGKLDETNMLLDCLHLISASLMKMYLYFISDIKSDKKKKQSNYDYFLGNTYPARLELATF